MNFVTIFGILTTLFASINMVLSSKDCHEVLCFSLCMNSKSVAGYCVLLEDKLTCKCMKTFHEID
uniref:Nodule Cysteine-Rich (NCR) secreted peptide n=1 Tax=Parastrongyloides trichosuri TaxID=131310 RepID=A0A0N5A702_PARTI